MKLDRTPACLCVFCMQTGPPRTMRAKAEAPEHLTAISMPTRRESVEFWIPRHFDDLLLIQSTGAPARPSCAGAPVLQRSREGSKTARRMKFSRLLALEIFS
ncbi:MAG: hypothetical protein B6D68_03885 [spirochete symbiont of Stewartia floridana]|nr:MAG: hypothetical protein B6D68_03885 [spirochete symbiont of Stewartia floridana]